MAISIDYLTNVISVPQADLTLVSGTLYQMDTNQFRKDLKALEASEEGIVFSDTHIHNTEVTVSGTTFARTLEIIFPYSVTFTPDSQYTVRLAGSNNNIFDVEAGILNQNQVQLIAQNSGGLINASALAELLEGTVTLGAAIRLILSAVTGKLSGANTTNIKIRDVADLKDRINATVDSKGNRTSVTLDGN